MLVPTTSSGGEESEAVTEKELLAIREQVLGFPAPQQDLLLRMLRLPPQQQILVQSALTVAVTGRVNTAPSPTPSGCPAATPTASPAEPPDRPPSVPPPWTSTSAASAWASSSPTTALPVGGDIQTVRNHLDEIAEAGGMEHYTGPLPAGFTLTAPYTIPCSWSRAERWYYVLNCSACGRKGVTAAGIGKSPETWARDKGWKPPNSGSAKWTRIVCPSCTGV